MKQQRLAMAADQGVGFERFRRRTMREDFLDTMNAIVPRAALCALIEPHYPQAGFGMKMHIGVDSQRGLVHSAVVTAANVRPAPS